MPDSVIETLRLAVSDLSVLIPPLENAVTGQRPAWHGEGRRSQPGSRPPWNPQPAMVLLDIHYGVRELEANLRYSVSGVLRQRGGSTGNTLTALTVIVPLAAGADYVNQQGALRKVTGWTWRARVALGEAEPLQPVPVQEGEPPARCPFCKYATLRMRPMARLVVCVNPGCADTAGNRPVARVEIGAGFGEPLLVWADETVGVAP